jgi:hypothetical protein
MRKYNQKRLMEMMERVNPDSVNHIPNEKEIIDDILSLDEGVSDMLSKMKEYARKGLLTATVILAVASAVAAGNVNGNIKYDDVVEKGVEMVDEQEQKETHAFFVGIASDMASQSYKQGNIDAAGAFKEIAKYHESLRDNEKPQPLSKNAQKYAPVLKNTMKTLNNNMIEHFINKGMNLNYKPN